MRTAKATEPRRLRQRILALAVASCFASGTALGNPSGATIVNGSVAISSAGSKLTVTNTPNAIINWHDFSINTGETTQFVQQSAASAVLNRVTGGDPSLILGTLQSNGRVFLINPSGIVFGAGSVVDVAGLVASTLNITDADFLAGKHVYNASIANAGKVSNAGEIRTPSGGFVYLIGTQVENSGVINTPSGEAVLAAGHSVEIVDSTDPNLRVTVRAQSQDVNLSQLMQQNNGNIFGVLNSGRVSANTVTQDATGKIYFKSAGNIATTAGSVTEAKGNSTMDGGYIRTFADLNGTYQGTFDVSGKNGGFIETSGHWIDVNNVEILARSLGVNGKSGTWLLDPYNIFVESSGTETCGSFTCTQDNSVILNATINNALGSGANVTLDTAGAGTQAGNITINADISSSYGGNTLKLLADNNISIANNVSIAGNFSFNATAGRTTAGGSIMMGAGSKVDITGDAALTADGSISASTATIKASSVDLIAGLNITALIDSASINAYSANSGTIEITAISPISAVAIVSDDGNLRNTIYGGPVKLHLLADPVYPSGSNTNSTIDLAGSSVGLDSPGNITFTKTLITVNTTSSAGGGLFSFNVNGDLNLISGRGDSPGPFPSVVSLVSPGGTMKISANNLTVTESNIDASTSCSRCNLQFNTNSFAFTGNGTDGNIIGDNNLTINNTGPLSLSGGALIDSVGTTAINTGSITMDASRINARNNLTLGVTGVFSADSATEIDIGTGGQINVGSISFDNDTFINSNGPLTIVSGRIGLDNGSNIFSSSTLALNARSAAADITLANNSYIEASSNLTIGQTTAFRNITLASNSFIDGDNLQLTAAGSLTLTDSSIYGFTATNSIRAGSLSLDNSFIRAFGSALSVTTASNSSLNNSSYFRTDGPLTASIGGVLTLTDSDIDSTSNINMTVGSLYETSSSINNPFRSGSNISIASAGDIVLNNGSDIVADLEVMLRIGGKLYLNSGGTVSNESHISTYSNNTIFLNFPTLYSGGFLLDGIEGVFISQTNQFTGFFTGTNLDIPAILNTNLFITYAPAGLITSVVGQNTTNTLATNPYLDPYGPYQTGPGDSSLTTDVTGNPWINDPRFSEVRECS